MSYDRPVPEPEEVSKFDPMYGFPKGRKERVMIATEEEMQSVNMPLDMRDYCAHKYLEFLLCRQDHYPLLYKCKHKIHAYKQCEFEDYVIRMKEFEREKRLLAREEEQMKLDRKRRRKNGEMLND